MEALDCGCQLGDVIVDVNGTVVLNQAQAIAMVRTAPSFFCAALPPLSPCFFRRRFKTKWVAPSLRATPSSSSRYHPRCSSQMQNPNPGASLKPQQLGRTMSRDLKSVVEACSVSLPIDDTA